MKKFQYIILLTSIIFFAASLLSVNAKRKESTPSVSSSQNITMIGRFKAIEKAKSEGSTNYSYSSIAPPPLI